MSSGVMTFIDEMIVRWVASMGISSTLCSILYFILQDSQPWLIMMAGMKMMKWSYLTPVHCWAIFFTYPTMILALDATFLATCHHLWYAKYNLSSNYCAYMHTSMWPRFLVYSANYLMWSDISLAVDMKEFPSDTKLLVSWYKLHQQPVDHVMSI